MMLQTQLAANIAALLGVLIWLQLLYCDVLSVTVHVQYV